MLCFYSEEVIMSQYHAPVFEKNISDLPFLKSQVFGAKKPSSLYFMGNLKLLEKPGVGFCGSRKITEKGNAVVRDCARQLALAGITIISGYAAGVDMAAHCTALESMGNTIIVLPEGINHFRIKRDIANLWDWERILVISQFQPDNPWQVYRAMERNSLIIALSRAMIVIEAGEKGGTLSAGYSSLKSNTPLFVVEYQDKLHAPGNIELLNLGAKRLRKSQTQNHANLNDVFSALHCLVPQYEQLNLI